MRVLVTGSDGFIGRHVCAELLRRGDEPVGFDRPVSITSSSDVNAAVRRVDAVIHLAGSLGTAELFGREHDAVAANIVGAVNVYEACGTHSVPLVQIGTGHKGHLNPYAITKGCAEDLALARAQWTGQRIAVVRAYHVYGPGQGVCPPYGTSSVRKIVPTFACRALAGVPLEINGSGRQLVDLVHVADVVAVLVDALAGPYGQVTEAGTGEATTVRAAAADIIDAAGSTSVAVHVPTRLGEAPDTVVVATDPACRNPWPHRLEETVDWYRAHLAAP